VRPQFQSGTHAIACALFGLLRPGQEMLAVSGAPYDTLEEVIGQRGGAASGGSGSALSDFGVGYRCLPLLSDGRMDLDAIVPNLRPNTRVCHIQRSCGYVHQPVVSTLDPQMLSTVTCCVVCVCLSTSCM
jgi:cystathionine beta-lyase family protein involved in aluminum resistance